jgi:S-layer protein
VLSIFDLTNGAAGINMTNAAGINSVRLQSITGGAFAITNAAAGFTLTELAASSAPGSIALATDTANDTVNLGYRASNGFANTGALSLAGIENINISTANSSTTATAPTTQVTGLLSAAAAKTVVLAGAIGFIGDANIGATTMTSVDGSGLTGTGTGGGLTWMTGALAAASTIKGSAAGTNTITFSAATAAVTYTGGSGIDTVVGSNGKNNVVNLGDGVNSYTQAGLGSSSVTGGSGVDTITTGSGADTITSGAGNDIINSGTGLDIIFGGAGADTFIINANTNKNGYASIMDAGSGDVLRFTGVLGMTFDSASIKLGATAGFSDFCDVAAQSPTAANSGQAAAGWFQFGGNTYVVVDVSNSTSFVNGTDMIVQLTGTVDLSTATNTPNSIIVG